MTKDKPPGLPTRAQLEDRSWRALKGAVNYVWQQNLVSWCFKEPVDEARHSAPGYYAVIANPQDLGSIRSRLEGGRHYSSPLQVDRDVRQMVHNAQTYNSAGHVVHKAAEDLLKLWAEQWEARRVGVLWEAAQAAAAGNQALLANLIAVRSRSGSVPPPGGAQSADGPRHRLAAGARDAGAAVVMPEDDTPLTPVRILLGKHAPLHGPDLDASPLPLLRSLLRATTWLPPTFMSCGGRRAQLLGGRTSEPELLLVRCLCSDCAASQLPGYMPLTHFYMHAHPAVSDAPDAAAAVLTCTASGALAPGAGDEEAAATTAAAAGGSGAAARPAGPGSAGAPGAAASARVADMESLKRRVWGALRCGGSLLGAEEQPFLDLMRARAEAGGGAALLGRRVWVYHFSEFSPQQQPGQQPAAPGAAGPGAAAAEEGGRGEEGPYGTWLPAAVTAYYADSGEHELRYDADPTGPSEVVQLGGCFLHWGAQPPPQPPLGVPSGPAGDRPRLPLSEAQLTDFFPDRWDGPLPPAPPPLPPAPSLPMPPQVVAAALPEPGLAAPVSGTAAPPRGASASAAATAMMAAAARAAAAGPEAAASYLRSVSSSGPNSSAAAAAAAAANAIAAAAAAAASAAAEAPIVIDDDDDDADVETLNLQAQFAALASQLAADGAGGPAPSAASASAAVAMAAAAPGSSGAGTSPHQRLGFLRAFPPILADVARSYAVDTQIRQRVAGALLSKSQQDRLAADNCQATRTALMSEVLKTLLDRPDLDAQATARAREWKAKWAASRREPMADAATTAVILAALPSTGAGPDMAAVAAAAGGGGAAAAAATSGLGSGSSPAVPGLPAINPHPGSSTAASAAGMGGSGGRHAPVPSSHELLPPQARQGPGQGQARSGAGAAAAPPPHPMAPGPTAPPPRVASPVPQPTAPTAGAVAVAQRHPSPFYPMSHMHPGMPQHAQPGAAMAPGPSSAAPAGAAAPPTTAPATHPYAAAGAYPPPGYMHHPPYPHHGYMQHPYSQPPYPPPHLHGPAYPYPHPYPSQPPPGHHYPPDGAGHDAQAAKRQRTEASAAAAAAGNPMAPGPGPAGAPANAAVPAAYGATDTAAAPPIGGSAAAAASSGGHGSVAGADGNVDESAGGVAGGAGGGGTTATGGGGGGNGGSRVLDTGTATETATGATSRGPAASSGGGAAPPASAAAPSGIDAAAWLSSRFRPMTQTPKDVVEMCAAINGLMEQVPLPPADARAVRKAMRQLQMADRDKFIGVTYMSLVAAAKAGDDGEIQDILEELREAADSLQRQQDAPKAEANSEAA